MNILAIGAHPDDLEYCCAGTLIQHAHRGDAVYLMIITDGDKGGDPEVRHREQLEAAKIIGAREVFFAGFPDTRFECNRESIIRIEEIIKRVEADTVYTHFGTDTHQDHRAIAQAVVPAARSVPNLLFFEGHSSQDFIPTIFVDIGKVINQKMAALEAHSSQVHKTNIQNMSILDISRSMANFRGIQGRVTYAEGFVALRYFIQM